MTVWFAKRSPLSDRRDILSKRRIRARGCRSTYLESAPLVDVCAETAPGTIYVFFVEMPSFRCDARCTVGGCMCAVFAQYLRRSDRRQWHRVTCHTDRSSLIVRKKKIDFIDTNDEGAVACRSGRISLVDRHMTRLEGFREGMLPLAIC